MLKAVFLDRDGVLNKNIVRDGGYYSPKKFSEFEIMPDAAVSCDALKNAGYILVVVTNQPDVGRQLVTKEEVESMHDLLRERLPIDHIEVCYHPGQGLSDCTCRKPQPGMLIAASDKLGIDLAKSWMIGDRAVDFECGHKAGCATIFVGSDYSQEAVVQPQFKLNTLAEAAAVILCTIYET